VLLALNPALSAPELETVMLETASPVVTGEGEGSPNVLLYVDPEAIPVTPAVIVTPSPDAVEVQGVAQESVLRAGTLAFTGGDPRALLMLALGLLLTGGLLSRAARRRETRRPIAAVQVGVASPPSALQLLPRQRR
jgi:hypothetical protein